MQLNQLMQQLARLSPVANSFTDSWLLAMILNADFWPEDSCSLVFIRGSQVTG